MATQKIFACLFVGICTLGTLSFGLQAQPNAGTALVIYGQAQQLFDHPRPTPRTDSLALARFMEAAGLLRGSPDRAALLLDCYEKAGVLHQTYDRQREAIGLYRKAVQTGHHFRLPDSLLFKPYLYQGSAYYLEHAFDSAIYFLEEAESVFLRHPALPEAERLYNAFGAIYYEAGNYRQSVNYFGKALELHQGQKVTDPLALYSFKSNIASALRHLEQYDPAIGLYRSLLPLRTNQDELFINLGVTYLEKEAPDSALFYLQRVSRPNEAGAIAWQNALGKAYLQKRQADQATRHLNRALAMYRQQRGNYKAQPRNPATGVTYRLLGDLERENRRFGPALQYYQQSIIQLDFEFNDTSVTANPAGFTTGFNSFLLFESLAAKATCLWQQYEAQMAPADPQGVLNAYQSTFRLAEYIEKALDSEEARLFLVRKVFPVYQRAVTGMVGAFERTGDPQYLREALRWSEKSKASVLYISLKENEIRPGSGIPDSLLRQERNLRYNLSRLFRQVDARTLTDPEAEALTAEVRDTELALSRLTSRLHEYPEYYRRKFSADSLSVTYLQQRVLAPGMALISYFESAGPLYAFVVTRNAIAYYRVHSDDRYRAALAAVDEQLHRTGPGENYQAHPYARLLYDRLVKPAEPALEGVSSLVIIPHNELALLPFEVLEDSRQRYLVEQFDVTYQYAASFLQHPGKNKIDLRKTLAVAPFGSGNTVRSDGFAPLPASGAEIEGLRGTKLVDESATKANFVRMAGDASVLHLATHAVANNEDPSRSYIAFYPSKGQEFKLFAHELEYAALQKAHLVFLSACETAAGKLELGEGVMSLSRAFSYAGCPNLVTSLWKAEDRATAYLSVRFYNYVREGHSFSKALQKAKLDLLHDREFVQFQAPQYWSHLVFIGAPAPENTGSSAWIGIAAASVLASGAIGWRCLRR